VARDRARSWPAARVVVRGAHAAAHAPRRAPPAPMSGAAVAPAFAAVAADTRYCTRTGAALIARARTNAGTPCIVVGDVLAPSAEPYQPRLTRCPGSLSASTPGSFFASVAAIWPRRSLRARAQRLDNARRARAPGRSPEAASGHPRWVVRALPSVATRRWSQRSSVGYPSEQRGGLPARDGSRASRSEHRARVLASTSSAHVLSHWAIELRCAALRTSFVSTVVRYPIGIGPDPGSSSERGREPEVHR